MENRVGVRLLRKNTKQPLAMEWIGGSGVEKRAGKADSRAKRQRGKLRI